MLGQHRRGDELPAEGARSGVVVPKRGAQRTRTRGVEVKGEWAAGDQQRPPVSRQSQQRLRKSILGRREAQGLERIQPEDLHRTPVKHQLTPEEWEKRERRKEQNRRAARKCRMKKRMQQSNVVQHFSLLMADNQARVDEVSKLKAQLTHLTQTIEDHNRSCQCCILLIPQFKTERGAPDVMPVSPVSMTSSASPASSMTSEDSPAAPPATDAWEACVSTSAQTVVDMDTYLQDQVPIQPDLTFTDLETYVKLDDLDAIPSKELIGSTIPSQEQPQQGHHSPPPSLRLLPPPFDAEENLTAVKASSSPPPAAYRYNQSLLCPVSPATNQGRLSTSSAASDWSVLTEQSQGFTVPGSVNNNVVSPILWSEPEQEGGHVFYTRRLPGCTTEDDDDDDDDDVVFSEAGGVFHSS